MKRPLATVSVVAFNASEFIEEALASVYEQTTDFPFEVVVYDDCSEDGTVAKAREVSAHSDIPTRFMCMEQNQFRLGRTLLLIIEREARGRYLARLDADDFWCSPMKLQRQVELLEAHPDIPLAATASLAVDKEGAALDDGVPRPDVLAAAPLVPGTALAQGNFISHSSTVIRLSALREPIPAGWEELRARDYALWSILTATGRVGFLPEIMTANRLHPANSWMGKPLAERQLDEFLATLWLAQVTDSPAREIWAQRSRDLFSYTQSLVAAEAEQTTALRAQAEALEERVCVGEERARVGEERARVGEERARVGERAARRAEDELQDLALERDRLAHEIDSLTKTKGYRALLAARRLFGRGGGGA